MKKFSPSALVVVLLAVAAFAMVGIGASRENAGLAFSGMGLGFVAVIASAVVKSIIQIKRQFPLNGDAPQGKQRVARYLKLAASLLLTFGAVMTTVGFVMQIRGVGTYLNIGWAMLAAGAGLSVVSSVIAIAFSKGTSASRTFTGGYTPPAAARMPYSPDPVISRILANPNVLKDERIRTLHAVQNLLQYPEIQQIFFEPVRLYELFDNPRVSELMNVVRERLTQGDAETIFAAAEQFRFAPGNLADGKPDRTDTRKLNSIVTVLVVFIFGVIFVIIFLTAK